MNNYLSLLRKIMEEGEYKEDRTGTGTRSIFGHQMRFDLTSSFPLVTTKKTHLRSIIEELIWFLNGDTNIAYLKNNNVRIWDEWATGTGDLGPVYSAMWRRWPVHTRESILIDPPTPPAPGPVIIPNPISRKLVESKYTGKYMGEHQNGDNPFLVIADLGYLDGKEKSYQIQFKNTGIYQVVKEHRLKNKSVSKVDPYAITVFDVGCVGSPSREFHRRFYDIWYNMLSRCYSPKNPNYHSYGGVGVYVSPRWLCFETFLEDLSRLPYYEEWLREPWNYHLDKDYYGGTCYDVSTCVFLDKEHNKTLTNAVPYIVTDQHGKTSYYASGADLCSGLGVTSETLRAYEYDRYVEGKLTGYNIVRYTGDKLVRRRIVIDQIANLISSLKTNPKSRRQLVVSWNPSLLPDEAIDPITNAQLGKQALPPCHTLFQFDSRMRPVSEILIEIGNRGLTNKFEEHMGPELLAQYVVGAGKYLACSRVEEFCSVNSIASRRLSCHLYQRSADCGLGVPFNIASYSLLTLMLAQVVGMLPGEFIWTGGDCHIYDNHREQIELQLTRDPLPLPRMELNRTVTEIDKFTYADFMLVDYQSHPHIPMPVAI